MCGLHIPVRTEKKKQFPLIDNNDHEVNRIARPVLLAFFHVSFSSRIARNNLYVSISCISKILQKLKYPRSIFFIISNEFCERFSYYGMRSTYYKSRTFISVNVLFFLFILLRHLLKYEITKWSNPGNYIVSITCLVF